MFIKTGLRIDIKNDMGKERAKESPRKRAQGTVESLIFARLDSQHRSFGQSEKHALEPHKTK